VDHASELLASGRRVVRSLRPAGRIANVLTVWDQIWPLAVAGALSPSITVIVLALLMRPDRPRTRVLVFWLGAVVAMLVWAILISSALWGVVTATERSLERFSGAINLVLAVLLLAFAVWRYFRKPPDPGVKPRFDFSDLERHGLWSEAVFGAVMQGRNVTSVLLFLAAQQHIDTSQIPAYEQLALTFIVIGIITASIWLPLLLPVKATDALHSRLAKPRDWLETHTKVIEVSAALLGSAYLFYRALA
jgi:threonine/homoserine/homoserine lactone efflux protein